MENKTLYIVLGIIIFIIADTFYVYYVLKKFWKKSRHNPVNRKPEAKKTKFDNSSG